VYLYVAIRKTVNWYDSPQLPPRWNSALLAINFFDFSQEPDHEWIELVNIAEWDEDRPAVDQAINLGGWDLTVGLPGAEGTRHMRIPDDTRIAPGGMLLLGFNKHDYGVAKLNTLGDLFWENVWRDLPAFKKNGIGLATHAVLLDNNLPPMPVLTVPTTADPRDFVSVPPMMLGELVWGNHHAYHFYDPDDVPGNEPEERIGDQRGGSVFNPYPYPLAYHDFVDSNGNGVLDSPPAESSSSVPDDLLRSTTDAAMYPPGIANYPAKAWDRIVELESDALNATSLADVAKIVLGGGMFPNYPEHDRIDNDGDGYILDRDGVDNNGNGLIDEGADGIDNNGNNLIWENDWIDNDGDTFMDEPGEGIDEWLESEGMDEGRWDVWGIDGVDNDLDGLVDEPGEDPVPFFDRPGSFERGASTDTPPIGTAWGSEWLSIYSGVESSTSNDSPAWREFVERRWYPGDSVIITLYEGRADLGHIVDRVTYTERDVVNRAIDDGVPVRYESDGNPGITIDDAYAREPLNVWYDTMWPENTMGIDFYRSLERKHPLYSGDRFGTSNRWQATDGNYDDWDDSLSLWQVANPLVPTTPPVPRPLLKFSYTLVGSPLRPNFFHRRVRDVLGIGPLWMGGNALIDANLVDPDNDRKFDRAKIRNKPFGSVADIEGLPHLTMIQTLSGFNPLLSQPFGERPTFDYDGLPLGYVGHNDHEWVDEILIGDRADEEDPDARRVPVGLTVDQAAFAAGGSTSALVLTVAQAEKPLIYWPSPADQWAADPPPSLLLTNQWFKPVYLFGDPDDNEEVLFGSDPLFDVYTGFAGGMGRQYRQQLLDRWFVEQPRDLRRAFYYAGNFDGTGGLVAFNQSTAASDNLAASPMAFFVWGEGAGVPNGRYEVSVALTDTLDSMRLLNGEGLISGSLLSADAAQKFLDVPRDNVAVRVKYYTDPKYYRQPELINGDYAVPPVEELGEIPELLLEAKANGIAYFGAVEIDQNFLAMRIRNWTNPGTPGQSTVCPFSRLILTPRDRVPGRININTAATHRVQIGTRLELFNPLMGLPGALFEYDQTTRSVDPFASYPLDNHIGLIDSLTETVPSWLTPLDPRDDITSDLLEPQITLLRKQNLYDRARTMLNRRPEWPDGRYYLQSADLLSSALPLIPEYRYQQLGNDQIREDESWFRYGKMANLITTRSDVFEIIVTAQTGYGVDVNGDGRINYRDPVDPNNPNTPPEFFVLGEKKIRMIYNR